MDGCGSTEVLVFKDVRITDPPSEDIGVVAMLLGRIVVEDKLSRSTLVVRLAPKAAWPRVLSPRPIIVCNFIFLILPELAFSLYT